MATPGNFDVGTRRDGSSVAVVPRGEIDMATVDLVRAAVDAHNGSYDELIVDLREVGFMDTSGLRYVLELTDRATRESFRFKIVRGPAAVQRVFDVSGLTGRLPLVDDPGDDPQKT